MATPTQQVPITTPTSTAVSAFASAPAVGGGTFATQRVVVANPHPMPWTFMASESALVCCNGNVIPRLARAYWSPGLGANAASHPMQHRGSGYIAQRQADGWVPIGHDVPATAWGVDRTSVPRASTYLIEHRVLRADDRVEVSHWTDAWTRPVSFGGTTRVEFDLAGWVTWCLSLIPMIGRGNGRSLADYQIDHACAPYIDRIRSYMSVPAQTPASRDAIRQILHHLPESHRPPAAVALVEV
jgi:hypothetical protein